jgi:hypothetical protein
MVFLIPDQLTLTLMLFHLHLDIPSIIFKFPSKILGVFLDSVCVLHLVSVSYSLTTSFLLDL